MWATQVACCDECLPLSTVVAVNRPCCTVVGKCWWLCGALCWLCAGGVTSASTDGVVTVVARHIVTSCGGTTAALRHTFTILYCFYIVPFCLWWLLVGRGFLSLICHYFSRFGSWSFIV